MSFVRVDEDLFEEAAMLEVSEQPLARRRRSLHQHRREGDAVIGSVGTEGLS